MLKSHCDKLQHSNHFVILAKKNSHISAPLSLSFRLLFSNWNNCLPRLCVHLASTRHCLASALHLCIWFALISSSSSNSIISYAETLTITNTSWILYKFTAVPLSQSEAKISNEHDTQTAKEREKSRNFFMFRNATFGSVLTAETCVPLYQTTLPLSSLPICTNAIHIIWYKLYIQT